MFAGNALSIPSFIATASLLAALSLAGVPSAHAQGPEPQSETSGSPTASAPDEAATPAPAGSSWKVGGFVGGIYTSGAKYSETYPFGTRPSIDYSGGGYGLYGGLRVVPGIEGRVDWVHHVLHPPTNTVQNVILGETSLTASWHAPELWRFSLSPEVGYRTLKYDNPVVGRAYDIKGPTFGLDTRVRVFTGAALDVDVLKLALDDPMGDSGGREIRYGIVVGAGPLDITIHRRSMMLDDPDPANPRDRDFHEYLLAVGFSFGYPPRTTPLMPPTPKRKKPTMPRGR